jgi:hypothetical protein
MSNEQWVTEQELIDAGFPLSDIEEALEKHLLQKSVIDGVVKYRRTYLARLLVGDAR